MNDIQTKFGEVLYKAIIETTTKTQYQTLLMAKDIVEKLGMEGLDMGIEKARSEMENANNPK